MKKKDFGYATEQGKDLLSSKPSIDGGYHRCSTSDIHPEDVSGEQLVFHYSKIRTFSDKIPSPTRHQLPKDAVIDALVLKVAITISNTRLPVLRKKSVVARTYRRVCNIPDVSLISCGNPR